MGGLTVVQVNYAWDRELGSADALLDRYWTLTRWSEAVAAAGVSVSVVQRFSATTRRTRNGIQYSFCTSPHSDVAERAATVDLVHVNGLIFSRYVWSLRRHLPPTTSIVMQDHGSQPDTRRFSAAATTRRALQRSTLKAADGFLFASRSQADPWREAGLIRPEQPVHEVMPASTDFRAVARDAARASTGIVGDPAMLWVGRLNANKDPLTVLAAFERSLSDLPAATLTMVYSDEEKLREVVERIEASCALRSRVRLVGRVDHGRMVDYFSAADVFVVGSHHEGSGYSLIEACACGCVPIVTDIPSFRAIAGGAGVGALWRPGDAGDCARCLVEVCGCDLRRGRTTLVRHFEQTLSWSVVARRALDIYSRTVARRKRAAATTASS